MGRTPTSLDNDMVFKSQPFFGRMVYFVTAWVLLDTIAKHSIRGVCVVSSQKPAASHSSSSLPYVLTQTPAREGLVALACRNVTDSLGSPRAFSLPGQKRTRRTQTHTQGVYLGMNKRRDAGVCVTRPPSCPSRNRWGASQRAENSFRMTNGHGGSSHGCLTGWLGDQNRGQHGRLWLLASFGFAVIERIRYIQVESCVCQSWAPSVEEPRPTRLPTPRNSISMPLGLVDPLSPTSTVGPVPHHPPRSRSPNATPMPTPPHQPRLPSTLASRKPSAANLRSVSNTQTSPLVSSKLSAQPLVPPPAKSPKVSRTAQGGPDATRARKVSGTSTSSPYQPRSRAQSLVSQSGESVQLRPSSPTKKAPALPHPESPLNPSPVKPKPRLAGVVNANGSPRPPAKTPGSRNTSNVFPPLENSNNNNSNYTPSPPPPKLPAVVWPVDEEEESVNGDWAPSLRPPVSGGTSEAYDFSGIPLGSEGVPQYRAEDEMTMELITEIDDGGELDEDMQASLRAVHLTHVKKLTHYKRLLESAQTSSASQLHALQAELRMLRAKLEEERRKKRELEMSANKDREALKVAQMKSALQQPQPASMNASVDLSTLLRGDGQGGFNETEIRKVVRAMRHVYQVIYQVRSLAFPTRIANNIKMTAMIRMLEKYAASTFDIVGNLPEDVAIKILGHLNVMELLEVEVVSKKWHMLVRHPAIWRHLCVELTATDPVPLRPPPNPEDWEPLYRSLHHRERNWATGQVQSIRFLKGHTGFCTTLILKGNRLISGSYDETIRVWDIRSGEEKKCLKAKAISCLDYLPDEEVLVAGFHDVGRVQLFSTVTWQPIQTLQGHLYGIRAVALSPKYLVSAGADKALVCWDWRAGQKVGIVDFFVLLLLSLGRGTTKADDRVFITKIVRFGQQTNLNIGVQIVDEDEGRIVGITIDGIVRTFSIREFPREMLSQFKLSELGGSDPVLSAKLSTVGVGSANMLQYVPSIYPNYVHCANSD
ncbi:WD40 domain-containing protein [Rhizoctonia solani AG-1 IA]|uniref:WD40 domain-containing protein n=1 Tax=Thanatephorus cucumeris (strain AG1-IA) TaxID=983506 RepID=L8WTW9_THACA|nr:WD40 domain-containing protein [Rhizoctonia solani AG-1 IA]